MAPVCCATPCGGDYWPRDFLLCLAFRPRMVRERGASRYRWYFAFRAKVVRVTTRGDNENGLATYQRMLAFVGYGNGGVMAVAWLLEL